jgi:hypothetical protein
MPRQEAQFPDNPDVVLLIGLQVQGKLTFLAAECVGCRRKSQSKEAAPAKPDQPMPVKNHFLRHSYRVIIEMNGRVASACRHTRGGLLRFQSCHAIAKRCGVEHNVAVDVGVNRGAFRQRGFVAFEQEREERQNELEFSQGLVGACVVALALGRCRRAKRNRISRDGIYRFQFESEMSTTPQCAVRSMGFDDGCRGARVPRNDQQVSGLNVALDFEFN